MTTKEATCNECGELLMQLGEWELLGGICPNWNKHTAKGEACK